MLLRRRWICLRAGGFYGGEGQADRYKEKIKTAMKWFLKQECLNGQEKEKASQ
jgi:hypothetical protein